MKGLLESTFQVGAWPITGSIQYPHGSRLIVLKVTALPAVNASFFMTTFSSEAVSPAKPKARHVARTLEYPDLSIGFHLFLPGPLLAFIFFSALQGQ